MEAQAAPSSKPTIRAATPADARYIVSAWCNASHSHLNAQLYLSRHGLSPPFDLYRQLFSDVQARLLARSKCLVAVNPEDSNQIFGFCVYEPEAPPVLHWIQVKKDFWRKGIAHSLLEAAGIKRDQPAIMTFTSPIFHKLAQAPAQWAHVPHWLIPSK